MPTSWDKYLSIPDAPRRYAMSRDRGKATYAPLREAIQRIIDRKKPHTVACLGACFIAFETFHKPAGDSRWFLDAEMQEALKILA